MKDKEHSLLYHTMHSRPMPGCLPLFFILALAVTAGAMWLVPVKMPERVAPRGPGRVYIKKDRFTDFMLRRQSPLPLQLPQHADPEYQEDVAAASMPLVRPVSLVPAPPYDIFAPAADSAVLDPAALLALPGVAAPEPVEEPGARLQEAPAPAREALQPAVQPEFHPGVEAELDNEGEEVQP